MGGGGFRGRRRWGVPRLNGVSTKDVNLRKKKKHFFIRGGGGKGEIGRGLVKLQYFFLGGGGWGGGAGGAMKLE